MTKIQTIPYVPVAESVQRRSRLFIRGHLLTRLVPYLLLGVPCYSNFQIWKLREMGEKFENQNYCTGRYRYRVWSIDSFDY